MVAAAGLNPTRPPANIEDFLWNVHMVLVSQPGPVPIDQFREVYSRQLGHKCSIERFLVVNENGLAATLKRIPHIVTAVVEGGNTSVKATQPAEFGKEQLIDKDKKYREELQKKNAMAKAKASTGGPAKAAQPAAAKAGEKRPADAPAGGDAKKGKDGSEAETLARMLVQGVVRVLQNRQKDGKGPLPLTELEEEFKALWKVPFNLQQAGETEVVSFFAKWPNKVEVTTEGDVQFVQLCKKGDGKAKAAAAPAKTATPASPVTTPATEAAAPAASATAAKAPAATAAKAPPATATAGATEAAKAAAPAKAPALGRPARPPSCIEDFLWNLHAVLEAINEPLPLDQLKDTYSKHFGHKCVIERFLVVGDGGLSATLKRIPHIVSLVQDKGVASVKATQPAGTTKEGLIAADAAFRKQLQDKNQAKAAAPAPAAPPKRAAESTPAAEPEAKKPKGEDAETLARMLVQGVVRVLQNRAKEGKGALPLASLEDEFKALWKVPFNLQQAGETDVETFLGKWPNKVELKGEGNSRTVGLAKKGGDKAKAASKAAAPAAAKAAAAPASPEAVSPAASPTPQDVAAPTTTSVVTAAAGALAAAAGTPPAVRKQAENLMQAVQEMSRDMARHQQVMADRVAALAAALKSSSSA